ncbi:MAG: DUF4476 domain-containing protein [Salibacteraceae bacterium]
MAKFIVYCILSIFIFSKSGIAQTALEIYSADKKRFYLFVDGLKENESPKNKVRIKNLPEGPHHIKIIFENRELNNPQTRLQLDRTKDYLYEIKLYTNLDRKWYDLNLIEIKEWSDKEIKKKAPLVTLSEEELRLAASKTDSLLEANVPAPIIEKPKDTILIKSDTAKSIIDLNTLNCSKPMHPKGYSLLVKKLSVNGDDKLKLAESKKLLRSNCLTSIQIMELMQIFEFEVSRIELATFAFEYCFDPVNYQFVEDAFEFDSSIKELHNNIYATKK